MIYISKKRSRFSCSRGDYLKLFLHLEGKGVSEYTPWSGVLCGELRDIPQVLYSSRSRLILEFHTESSPSNATGFSGIFRFIDRRKLKFLHTNLTFQTINKCLNLTINIIIVICKDITKKLREN